MDDPIEWRGPDGRRLAKLRDAYLEGAAGANDYWEDERLVELYDRTFGARIGWKWDFVLERTLDLLPTPPTRITDLGCGSAIATRALLRHLPDPGPEQVLLVDRSDRATLVAERLIAGEHPDLGLGVQRATRPPASIEGLALVSHVLTELTDDSLETWLASLATADAILFVEPGTRVGAACLVDVRERLLEGFAPLAPCTHTTPCPLRTADRDWCHQFAPPAPEAFTESHWRRFADTFSIDLRSLPLAHLLLVRRDLAAATDPGFSRLLGRPRIEKGRAFLDVCDEAGYRTLGLLQRTDKSLFKQLDRGKLRNPALRLEEAEGRIQRATEA